jgi:hypothetical protein
MSRNIIFGYRLPSNLTSVKLFMSTGIAYIDYSNFRDEIIYLLRRVVTQKNPNALRMSNH